MTTNNTITQEKEQQMEIGMKTEFKTKEEIMAYIKELEGSIYKSDQEKAEMFRELSADQQSFIIYKNTILPANVASKEIMDIFLQTIHFCTKTVSEE